jgi:hypothetical protein
VILTAGQSRSTRTSRFDWRTRATRANWTTRASGGISVRGEDGPNERNPEFESKKLPPNSWLARFHNYGIDPVAVTAYVECAKLIDVP